MNKILQVASTSREVGLEILPRPCGWNIVLLTPCVFIRAEGLWTSKLQNCKVINGCLRPPSLGKLLQQQNETNINGK